MPSRYIQHRVNSRRGIAGLSCKNICTSACHNFSLSVYLQCIINCMFYCDVGSRGLRGESCFPLCSVLSFYSVALIFFVCEVSVVNICKMSS